MSYPQQPRANPDPSFQPAAPTYEQQPPAPPTYEQRPVEPQAERHYEQRETVKSAKTSAAAAFALIFGVSALLSVLTVIFGPFGIVLAIVGIVLGIVGIRNSKRAGVTGRGVAIGGLGLSVIALLLAAALAAGVTFFLNDESAVNRLEQQVQQLQDRLPDTVNIPQP